MTKFNEWIRDDSGLALAIVVTVAALLFLLATTVLVYTEYRQMSSNHALDRNKAMYLADAGINEYVYQLSQNSQYAETVANQTMARTVSGQGSWAVTATPSTGDSPLKLAALGTLTDGSTRRVTATVFPQSFADYVVLVGSGDYIIGADATFGDATHPGKVRSNGNIENAGIIYGLAEAHLNCLTDSGGTPSASFLTAHYPGGIRNGVSLVDFSVLSTNWNDLRSYATAAGTFYGASGAGGYMVTINGSTVTIDKVSTTLNKNVPRTGVTPADPALGAVTTTNVVTGKAIPAKGVFFFDDTVWVRGNYSANITIMTSGTMYCPYNVVPTDPNANYTCGLAAATNMLFPFWYGDDDQTLQAATLCRDGGIGQDSSGRPPITLNTYNTTTHTWSSTTSDNSLKTRITLKGARAMNNMIGFSSAYTTRVFTMDPHLATNPPPKYPTIPGGLHVDTWREY